jgi:hypothetical protein
VVGGVGAAGGVLMAFALATRWRAVFPFGIALVGASYGVFLACATVPVDQWSPIVAAVLFVSAELGYWSLEAFAVAQRARRASSESRRPRGAAFVTGLVGSLVLVVATGAAGGVGLEAAGVAAAVLAVAAIARLASRASV